MNAATQGRTDRAPLGNEFAAVMDALSAAIKEETDLIAAGRLRDAGPVWERKAEIASYGFECKCEACLDPVASDARRLEIATPLESQLQRGDISGALKATLGRIALIRREGLEELKQYKSLYLQLEMTFRLMGDLARAAEVKKESDRLSWAHFNEPGVSLFF